VVRSADLAPTRSAAQARIAAIQPEAYARTRNHLQGAVTGLSPYLTHGLVTTRQVLAGVLEREPLAVGHKLVFELGWREYFRHVWSHRGDGILDSLHEGPLPDAAYDTVLPADIRQARTGVPVIDQAVRALYATGTLHNHARMWLASYVVHLRRVHWRAGADWMVAHLLDGDLASNHLSWQWVAGTGSHKPYLFNADNVARYAPSHWHSPGTVIDQTYEALDRLARGGRLPPGPSGPHRIGEAGLEEPPQSAAPPSDLGVLQPSSSELEGLAGREVWLVHPWALRPPPADLAPGTEVVGLYLREVQARWPWSEARWRWVDAAMTPYAQRRWWVSAHELGRALTRAARVRAEADPHVASALAPFAQLLPVPVLFPEVARRCDSFSQWWTRATRGLQQARDLL
jgi:deoxyribodipyrimidine photo-lyase